MYRQGICLYHYNNIFLFFFAKDTLMAELKKLHIDTPNNRYEERDLGTWSSVSDVDAFMKAYNHDNNYEGLSLGNYVTILDGTYNAQWMIAGFDIYPGDVQSSIGIAMVPRTTLGSFVMNDTATTTGGYIGSKMHKTILPEIATKLQIILGTHMMQQQLLATNYVDSTAMRGPIEGAPAFWTHPTRELAYLSLMSEPQVAGCCAFGSQYDIGEASERLPVFNYRSLDPSKGNYAYGYWLRNVVSNTNFGVYYFNGILTLDPANEYRALKPVMYIK
jgi:hypothetical protein